MRDFRTPKPTIPEIQAKLLEWAQEAKNKNRKKVADDEIKKIVYTEKELIDLFT